jgi:hypothetical protein
VFATNATSATNERLTVATNKRDSATNRPVVGPVPVLPLVDAPKRFVRPVLRSGLSGDNKRPADSVPEKGSGVVHEEVGREAGAAGLTKNRRSRDAYNAYQREYMKAWRQKLKSKQP